MVHLSLNIAEFDSEFVPPKKASSFGSTELLKLSRVPICEENGQRIKEQAFRTLSHDFH